MELYPHACGERELEVLHNTKDIGVRRDDEAKGWGIGEIERVIQRERQTNRERQRDTSGESIGTLCTEHLAL